MCKDCGCGGHDEEYETITLTLDDGTEVVCEVIGTFDLDGINYIALMPEDDEEVLIYRYSEEDEQISLQAIESDEEFEAVSEAFDELFFEEDDDDDDDDEENDDDEDDDDDDDEEDDDDEDDDDDDDDYGDEDEDENY